VWEKRTASLFRVVYFPEMSTMNLSSRRNIQEDLDRCRTNRSHQNLEKLGIKYTFIICGTGNFKPKWLRKNRAYISRQNWGKQDKQCIYNAKFRRVGQPLLMLKNYKYYISCARVCNLWYLACKVHAPYCHLWPDQLYNIFPHLKEDMIFEKIFQYKICVLIFCTTLSETFSILRRI